MLGGIKPAFKNTVLGVGCLDLCMCAHISSCWKFEFKIEFMLKMLGMHLL